ncbi:MAG: hypothetical protein ACMUJM_21345 [bacterium]
MNYRLQDQIVYAIAKIGDIKTLDKLKVILKEEPNLEIKKKLQMVIMELEEKLLKIDTYNDSQN